MLSPDERRRLEQTALHQWWLDQRPIRRPKPLKVEHPFQSHDARFLAQLKIAPWDPETEPAA